MGKRSQRFSPLPENILPTSICHNKPNDDPWSCDQELGRLICTKAFLALNLLPAVTLGESVILYTSKVTQRQKNSCFKSPYVFTIQAFQVGTLQGNLQSLMVSNNFCTAFWKWMKKASVTGILQIVRTGQ